MPRFDSTAVLRGEYDAESRVLQLWFPDSPGPYGYRDVPEDVFDALCDAESKGRFFARHIRDQYELIPPRDGP